MLTQNAASATFTPSSLGGLTLWTNPKNLGSLTLDGSNNVDSQLDLSSNARTATQTGANRPVWGASVINGNPAISYTPGQFQNLSSSISLTNYTMFAVYQPTDVGGVQCILGSGGSTIISTNGGTIAELYASAYRDWTISFSNGVPVIITNTCASDVSTATLAVNNVSQTVAITSGSTTSFSLDWIGKGYTAPFLLNGALGEVIVYNRVLSGPEIAQVYAYLSANWAI